MSEPKHTQGPWRVGDAGYAVFGPPNGTPSPETVATVLKRANARLIAAAPDLLSAMQFALKRLHHANQYGDDMRTSRELCVEDAKALLIGAIAKALGES